MERLGDATTRSDRSLLEDRAARLVEAKISEQKSGAVDGWSVDQADARDVVD